tara:strand:- start:202 stop:1092 length:891 start_codon:yes stop_codon:yes gene_type:complete
MATDTTTARVPLGSYILNEGATKTFPFMKEVASMFRADSEDMANSLGAVLTNGETYIPPDGVEVIGVETLEIMNETPKEGAHDAIDRLMAMNTLKNLKPMYGGGEVEPTAYRGGGMVEDNLMSMMGGGMAKKKKGYGYQEGGEVMFPPQPADPFQIDKRQADPSMYEGSVLGGGGMEQNPPQINETMANPEMYVDAPTDPLLLESEMLEEEMVQNQMMQEDLVVDRARKSLELIKIMGLLRENAELLGGNAVSLDSVLNNRSGVEITPRSIGSGYLENMPYREYETSPYPYKNKVN